MKMHEGFFKLFKKSFTSEVVNLPGQFKKLSTITNGFMRSIYWLVGGSPGSGKTSLVDEMFVLSLFDWWYENYGCSEEKFKISWIYHSLERNRNIKIAKWTCMRLFKETGDMISTATIIGATKLDADPKLMQENKLLAKHRTRIEGYKPYFEELEKHLILYDGSITPKGLYNRCLKFAKEHGKFVKREKDGEELGEDYLSNHPNHFVFCINDHVGKIRGDNDKVTLDQHSENMGVMRDKCLFIPVDIYQFNRGLADSTRKKNEDMFPRLEDFKGTNDGVENADAVLALFNPYRYNVSEFNGHDIESFISESGENRFRSASMLKNSYGRDDVDVALGFMGEIGKFYELPTAKELTNTQEKAKVRKLLKLDDGIKKPSGGIGRFGG